ncbi:MAG: Mov34/MPN/PAD-1 family protein [Candidatus Brocadiales bacterium]
MRLGKSLLDEIKGLAKKSYPYECGGFIAGKSGSCKEVTAIYPLENQNKSTPKVRFEIDAKEFQRVEDEATRNGLELLVFYHSHPDHPALPSAFDTERAAGLAPFWPELSYLIVSIVNAEDFEFNSWVFDGNSTIFKREEMVVA